jgi:putative nucleotidyltransferase with HDIG domain
MFNYLNIRNTSFESHSVRVANLCVNLSINLKLDINDIKLLYYSSLLHDIGQVTISDDLLAKTGTLNLHEKELIKSHVEKTLSILHSLNINQEMIEIIKYHHERLDGSGYPYEITDIPFLTRILCVCDVSEALLSERPYRVKKTLSDVNNILMEDNKFDKIIARECIDLICKNSNCFEKPSIVVNF